jgi:hypothetical protein
MSNSDYIPDNGYNTLHAAGVVGNGMYWGTIRRQVSPRTAESGDEFHSYYNDIFSLLCQFVSEHGDENDA